VTRPKMRDGNARAPVMIPPMPGNGGKSVAPVAFKARRVKKAYEQVADQLQEMIFRGVLARGDRLPSETALAGQYGVSRATVREALRLLAAQSLISTNKGAGGGSFVTLPSVDHISEFLNANIALMTASRDITLEEFLEAREMLEVPAARLAAKRRSRIELEHVSEAIPEQPLALDSEQQFAYNKGFHSAVVEASGNTLIVIAAQPIFSVLQTNLARTSLGREFHATINAHHREIADAIERGDADAAGSLMHEHLAYLPPFYEQAWKHAKKEALG
jgi:GntR family transcriptional repressor for pyruvate dehydrogenase complex